MIQARNVSGLVISTSSIITFHRTAWSCPQKSILILLKNPSPPSSHYSTQPIPLCPNLPSHPFSSYPPTNGTHNCRSILPRHANPNVTTLYFQEVNRYCSAGDAKELVQGRGKVRTGCQQIENSSCRGQQGKVKV